MTALLDVEPRVAGTDVIDPAIYFAQSEDDLHDLGRCQWTILCEQGTNVCPQTGPPA